jgi:hypothetical protein
MFSAYVSRILDRRRERRRKRQFARQIRTLEKRVAARQAGAREVADTTCDRCGAPLSLLVSDDGCHFAIGCSEAIWHVRPSHENPFVRFDDAPQTDDPVTRMDVLASRIASGEASQAEALGARCPICGAAMQLSTGPNGYHFIYSCSSADPFHYYRGMDISNRPSWWRSLPRLVDFLDD